MRNEDWSCLLLSLYISFVSYAISPSQPRTTRKWHGRAHEVSLDCLCLLSESCESCSCQYFLLLLFFSRIEKWSCDRSILLITYASYPLFTITCNHLQSLAQMIFLIQEAVWRDVLVFSLLCILCESVSCIVLCRRSLCNTQTSGLLLLMSQEVAIFEVRQLCFPAITHVLPCPEFLGLHQQSRDSAASVNLAYTAQLKFHCQKGSFSAWTKAIPRKLCRRDMVYAVLPSVAYCSRIFV